MLTIITVLFAVGTFHWDRVNTASSGLAIDSAIPKYRYIIRPTNGKRTILVNMMTPTVSAPKLSSGFSVSDLSGMDFYHFLLSATFGEESLEYFAVFIRTTERMKGYISGYVFLEFCETYLFEGPVKFSAYDHATHWNDDLSNRINGQKQRSHRSCFS